MLLRGQRWWLLLLVGVVAITWRSWGAALSWPLTDADAWADVAWARHPLGDQVLTRLTGGVAGDNANFWRPLAMLQFWVQRRLFGWEAAGWHAWDLGLHVIATMVFAALVHTTTRRRAPTVIAALLFVSHPLADEVVPAVARNLDLLLGIGVFGALLGVARRSPLGWGLGLLVALGAKEAGALVPVWTMGWILVFRADLPVRARLGMASRWGLAGALIVGGYLLVRGRVLHGMGGYFADGEMRLVSKLVYALHRGFVEPVLPGLSAALGAWPTAAGLGGLAVAGAVVLGWLARGRDRRLVVFGLLLWVSYVVLLGVTGTYTRRVLYVPIAGFVLLATVALLEVRRRRSWVGGAVALGWGATAVAASPVVVRYTDWGEAGRAAEVYRRLDTWATIPDGATVYLVDRPYRVDLDPRKDRLWSRDRSLTHTAVGYSIQAWLDEMRPGIVVKTATAWILDRPLVDQTATVTVDEDGVHVRRSGGRRRTMSATGAVGVVNGDVLDVSAPEGTYVMVWTGDGVEVVAPRVASFESSGHFR